MIVHKKLETTLDVESFIVKTQAAMGTLAGKRQKCYNRLRRCTDPKERDSIKNERDGLTQAIGLHRRDIKLAYTYQI